MLSVIIPTLNEEENILQRIRQIRQVLHNTSHEIIVSDDGSTDMTVLIAMENADKVISNPHYGKGYAIKQGIEMAQGQKICYIDADNQISAEYLKLADEYHVDLILGAKKGQRTKIRAIGSAMHHLLVKKLFGIRFDTNTGFKIWDAKILKYVSKNPISHNSNFEVEYIYKAQQLCASIYEYPIELLPDNRPSRFTFMNLALSVLDLFRLRLILWLK